MAYITLSTMNGKSTTFNTDNITHVADDPLNGLLVYLSSGHTEWCKENYLDVVGLLKGITAHGQR